MVVSETDAGSPPSRVTPSEFLRELMLFAPPEVRTYCCAFIGHPAGPGARWGGRPYDPETMASVVDGWTRMNAYFSPSGVVRGEDGRYERLKTHFYQMYALLADDVELDSLMGSVTCVVHTSEKKCQVSIFLDPEDEDTRDIALIDELLREMGRRKLVPVDKSGNNPVRWGRLPGGQNQKHDPAYNVWASVWAPSVRSSLADAAAVFGIDLDVIRKGMAEGPADASGRRQAGAVEFQDEKLSRLVGEILDGVPGTLHQATLEMAASLVVTGIHPGAAVNFVRAVMDHSRARELRERDWQDRWREVPRLVRDAAKKFPVIARAGDTIECDPETGEILGLPELLPQPERKNRFTSWGELRDKKVRIDWLARGLFELNAILLIFGASGSGKSFVAIYLACCVATGRPFFGRDVKQGPVFLILGEGEQGIIRRIKAWEKHTGHQVPDNMLFISDRGAELTQSGDAQALSAEVREMAAQAGADPLLVLIDTLHANFGPGDENSAADMGAFLGNVKQHIRVPFRCTVGIVHHSGHEQERARGSSSLRAALDQEYRVEARGFDRLTLSCTKMKDAEPPEPFEFRLVKGIDLGVDEETDTRIEGATIDWDGNPFERELARPKGGQVVRAIDLINLLRDGYPGPTAVQAALGMPERSVQRLMAQAVKEGLIESLGKNKGYAVTEATLQQLSHRGEELVQGHDAAMQKLRDEGHL